MLDLLRRQTEADTLAWLDKAEIRAKRAMGSEGFSVSNGNGLLIGLKRALASDQAGHWVNDHREETNHYTGWNYVAVRALALQFAQADFFIFRNLDDEQKGTMKALGPRKFCKQFGRSGVCHRTGAPLVKFHRGGSAMVKAFGGDQLAGELLPNSDRLVRLFKRPNRSQSGAMARYEEAMQLTLTGNSLIWRVPNRLGLTVERYVIPTAITTPILPCNEYPRGALRISPTNVFQAFDDGFVDLKGYVGAIGATVPMEQIVVKRWPHPLFKSDGYSALSAGSLWSDCADQVDQARFSQLKQGADPSLAISFDDENYDPDESDLDRYAEKIKQKYGGAQNAGKVLIVPNATSVNKLTQTPTEMAYVQAHEQLQKCMMALHGTPPIAAGIEQSGTGAAFWAALLQYVRLTVQPNLNMVAEAETEEQLPEFGDDLTLVYEAQSIEDPAMLEEQLKNDGTVGTITVNEWRATRGRDPVPWGDVPVGRTTVEKRTNVDEDVDANSTPESAGKSPLKPKLPTVEPPAPMEAPAAPVHKSRRELIPTGLNGHHHNGNGHVSKPWEGL